MKERYSRKSFFKDKRIVKEKTGEAREASWYRGELWEGRSEWRKGRTKEEKGEEEHEKVTRVKEVTRVVKTC